MCPFRLTKEMYDKIMSEFSSKLLNMKIADGRFKYEYKIDKKSDKPTIFIVFSMQAYIKMTALIENYSTEVGWRGLVDRFKDNAYYIYDILVFPQYITDVTVTTKEEEYNKWMGELDDETFNKLRFYGHSHVNMPTIPSDVDMDERQRIIDQMGEDDYVIFGICNKRNEFNFTIYDMKTGIMYEKDDIDYYVEMDNGDSLDAFLAEAKKLTKKEDKKPATMRVLGDTKNTKKDKKENPKKVQYNGFYYEDDDDDDELDYFYKTRQYEHGYDTSKYPPFDF